MGFKRVRRHYGTSRRQPGSANTGASKGASTHKRRPPRHVTLAAFSGRLRIGSLTDFDTARFAFRTAFNWLSPAALPLVLVDSLPLFPTKGRHKKYQTAPPLLGGAVLFEGAVYICGCFFFSRSSAAASTAAVTAAQTTGPARPTPVCTGSTVSWVGAVV